MWSDSIYTAIEAMLSELNHYSKEPFRYSDDDVGKCNFIEALTQLYIIVHRLDASPQTEEQCREQATASYELARTPS